MKGIKFIVHVLTSVNMSKNITDRCPVKVGYTYASTCGLLI